MSFSAILALIIKILAAKDTIPLIVKGVRMGLSVGQVLKFVSVIQKIQSEVAGLLKDGDFTVDEAEAEAAKLLGGEDIKVKVGGEDVLDDKAQDLLVRGLARVIASTASAKLK